MDVEKLIERLKNYSIKDKALLNLQTVKDAAEALTALQAELERVKAERDAAIKTIFQWTGCPECKWWDSADEWCKKHDREADSCGGCDSPEWRGQKEE